MATHSSILAKKMDSIKRLRNMMPEDEPLRLEGVQYATGEERRAIPSSSRKSEAAWPKPKGHAFMDGLEVKGKSDAVKNNSA